MFRRPAHVGFAATTNGGLPITASARGQAASPTIIADAIRIVDLRPPVVPSSRSVPDRFPRNSWGNRGVNSAGYIRQLLSILAQQRIPTLNVIQRPGTGFCLNG